MVTDGYTVRLPTKIVYGLGSISDGVKNTTFSVFLLFFYTQVVGLAGSLAGAAILVALVVDAMLKLKNYGSGTLYSYNFV